MNSVWELETFYRKRNIVIIGSGFSGLWTAVAVKEKYPEKSVLIIERNTIPLGASTRNAGFACFGSLTEVIADAQKMGWEKTLNLVKMRFDGLQKIGQYFKNSEIDFKLNGGYEILGNNEPLHHIKEVNQKMKSITGFEETYSLKQDKIKEFGLGKSPFLIENPCEGSLHSGKLLQKLLEKCHEIKVEFLFGTEVKSIEEQSDEIEVHLPDGISVKTDQLIYCTNAFSSEFLKNENIIPARGQILLTEPIDGLKLNGTFHYDEGFYYFRNLENRVLLGGGRNRDLKTEETTAFATTEFLQRHLEDFLKEVILPGKDVNIALRWSGIMAMGDEKTPIIKQISERQFCAVRLSGMGVALAPVMGEKIAELI